MTDYATWDAFNAVLNGITFLYLLYMTNNNRQRIQELEEVVDDALHNA